jgi:transposase
MPKQSIPSHGYTAEQLKHLAKQRPNAAIAERLRAVAWAMEGVLQEQIAKRVDRSLGAVRCWMKRWRAGGLEAMRDAPRPGQPTRLAREREEEFRQRVKAGPRPEDKVAVFRAQDLLRILSQEFDAEYKNVSSIYDLMRRLRLSWKTGRPSNPKAPEAETVRQWVEADAPLLSTRKRKS